MAKGSARKAKGPTTGDVFTAARQLVRESRSATLATSLPGKRQGWPYASLVTVACLGDATPILLLSGLADHSRNLVEDARASLLFEAASHLPNPQTGPRLTITGRLSPVDDEAVARRFLGRHPGAKLYAGFGDFNFYRMRVERGHFVGGFGRAQWFGANKLLFDAKVSANIGKAEAATVDRLNIDHGDDIAAMARKRFGGRAIGWRLTGVDPEGIDLRCRNSFRRIAFDRPLETGRGVKAAVIRMCSKKST